MLRGRTPLSVASTLIRGQSSLSRPAPSATMSTAAEQAGAEEVLLQRRGAAVVVTLNRSGGRSLQISRCQATKLPQCAHCRNEQPPLVQSRANPSLL